MAKYLAYLALLGSLAVGAAWYASRPGRAAAAPPADLVKATDEASWVSDLASENPRDNEKGRGKVAELGVRALPQVQATLRDPSSDRGRRRAALRACAVLGLAAEPAVPEVAAALPDPALTAEAAIALSFMGAKALQPLSAALESQDHVVRREALRAIGKLRFRAPVESSAVVPLLLDGMIDLDGSVRVVAATYLGIIHEDARGSIPLLAQGLEDPDPAVRRAAAEALGSFGPAAAAALPGLRKAAAATDPELATEAGRAVVAVSGGSK